MFDVVAATVDVNVRGPRYGDGDNGTALVLDPPAAERWSGLLAIGAALFDAPGMVADGGAGLWQAPFWSRWLAVAPSAGPEHRPSHYADAGLTVLRSSPSDGEEIWCRCDAGPHGFLSIAAHAHADALAVEVRYNGVDVLADPGTYCYHGEPSWRRYFRSTLAHNTVEVGGSDQSTLGRPLPLVAPGSEQVDRVGDRAGRLSGSSRGPQSTTATGSLNPPLSHRRSVRLVSGLRQLEIVDRLETTGEHGLRLAFHLGPDIDARNGRAECGADLVGWRLRREAPPSPCRSDCRGHSTRERPTRPRMVFPELRCEAAGVGARRTGNVQWGRLWTPTQPCSSFGHETRPTRPCLSPVTFDQVPKYLFLSGLL